MTARGSMMPGPYRGFVRIFESAHGMAVRARIARKRGTTWFRGKAPIAPQWRANQSAAIPATNGAAYDVPPLSQADGRAEEQSRLSQDAFGIPADGAEMVT